MVLAAEHLVGLHCLLHFSKRVVQLGQHLLLQQGRSVQVLHRLRLAGRLQLRLIESIRHLEHLTVFFLVPLEQVIELILIFFLMALVTFEILTVALVGLQRIAAELMLSTREIILLMRVAEV